MSAPIILGFRDWLSERITKHDSGHSTPCWVWQRSVTSNGYARAKAPGHNKQVAVHRAAYEELVGAIPDGLELDHLCRVRRCCNPAHLEPVTHAENLRRGTSNKPQSHCRKGHTFTQDNVVVFANGTRTCRTCHVAWHKEHPRSQRA